MTSDGKSGVVTEVVVVRVFFAYCALCDNHVPSDPVDKVKRGCRSEAGARKELAFHRKERHVADWFPDVPRCELCGETGRIPWVPYVHHLQRSGGTTPALDRTGEMQRLEKSDTPWPLPEQWWHSSCRSAYLADPQLEDEIDNRYEDKIKEERAWAEQVHTLVEATEDEGVLWSDPWKQIGSHR